MKVRILLTFISLIINGNLFAQFNAPDVFPRAQGGSVSNLNAPAVDLSTGVIAPNYHLMDANGVDTHTGVDLVYTGGQGLKVHEKASSIGLGWDLKAGGYIKRIVKGVRDEKATTSNAVSDGYDFFEDIDHEFVYGRFDHKKYLQEVTYHAGYYYIPGLNMTYHDWEYKCNSVSNPFEATINGINYPCTCSGNYPPTSVSINCIDGNNSYSVDFVIPPNDTTYLPFPYADNMRISKLTDFYFNTHSSSGISIPTGSSIDFWEWQQFQFLYDVDHQQADGEPDEFYFSFDGISGTFVLDTAGYSVLTPRQNIRIIPAIGPHASSAWIFILPDGTKYKFINSDSYREHTLTISNPYRIDNNSTNDYDEAKTDTAEAITKWYLSSKTSPNGDVINYEYEDEDPIELVHSNHSSSLYVGHITENDQQPQQDYSNTNVFNTTVDVSSTEKILDPKRLKKITAKNESIEFILSTTERSDLPDHYPIQYLRKKNWQGNLIGEIEFEQSYFDPSSSTDPDLLRLKLDGYNINPVNVTGDPIKYQFAYNTSENLPGYNSPKQDFWGFYNDNTASNLIPEVNVSPSEAYLYGVKTGADRSPDVSKTEANILTQVILPKGGIINYEYELNNYFDASSSTNKDWGGLRIKRIIQNDGFNSSNEMVSEYEYNDKNNSTHSSGEVMPIRRLFDIHFEGAYCFRSDNSSRQTSSDLIRYKNVTYKMPGKGKTVNEFTAFSTNPDDQSTKQNYEFVPGIGTYSSCIWHSTYTGDKNNDAGTWGFSRSYERGLLTHTWVYDEVGALLTETENTYEFNINTAGLNKVPTLHGQLNAYSAFPFGDGPSGYLHNLEFFYYESNWCYLKNTVTKAYDEYDPTKYMTIQVDFTYNNDLMQLIEKKTYTSDGRIIRVKSKYPQDFADLSSYTGNNTELKALKLMQLNGISMYPIESISTVEESSVEKVSSGVYTQYTKTVNGDYVKPQTIYTLKIDNLLSSFSNSNVNLTQNKVDIDSHYKIAQIREYLIDDNKNNLINTKTEFGLPSNWLYSSFNHDKVIGKVTNAFIDNDYQNPNGPSNDVGFNDFDSYINDDGDGEQGLWNLTGLPASIVSTQSHTGDYSYRMDETGGGTEITFMNRSVIPSDQTQKYLISLWARTDNNYTTGEANLKVHLTRAAGGANLPTNVADLSSPIENTNESWKRYELIVDVPSVKSTYGDIRIDFSLESHALSDVYVDDIVLSPINAACEFYIYNNLGQKTAVLNTYSQPVAYYDYDGLGRLEWVYDKDKYLLAHYKEYAKDFSNSSSYYSVEEFTYKTRKKLGEALNEDDYIKSRTYTDGLGRPLQTIINKQSPGFNDLVIFHQYDQFGNEQQVNLPYAGSGDNGEWKSNPLTDQRDFYQQADRVEHSNDPYSTILRENSPFQRLQEAGAPGTDWQPGTGHTIKKHYSFDIANEVRYWTYQTTSNNGAISNSFYDDQTLIKDITLDEQDHEIINYYDSEGKLVCSKRLVNAVSDANGQKTTFDFSNGEDADDATLNIVSVYQYTYYVYNKLGKLMYTLPPRAIEILGGGSTLSFNETDIVFSEQVTACYYDEKGRVIEKKMPGSGKKCFVYDKMNDWL